MRRQIDFILVDGNLRSLLVDSECADIDFKSDHRCVRTCLQPRRCSQKVQRRGRTAKKNTTDLDLDLFHAELDIIVADTSVNATNIAEKVVQAAHRSSRDHVSESKRCQSDVLLNLFAARRQAVDPNSRKELTKDIWKQLRVERKARESEKLDKILAAGRGHRELSRMMCAPVKRKQITAITDSLGNKCSKQDQILEVFTQFYEHLYSALPADTEMQAPSEHCNAITLEEIVAALRKLRPGKSCGDDGLYAEMLKTKHAGLVELIARVFTDVLHGTDEAPSEWCVSRLVVLYKKGDASLPKNYRPIAIIPVLCKLFSSVILARIGPALDLLQDPEQGGFRPDYSCSDMVTFIRLVAEKAEEWGEEVWAASLDLEKAFDKVSHDSVLSAVQDAGIDREIVRFLWHSYRNQAAYVSLSAAAKGRLFRILRGVRQGDPLSPALFNNVTRKVYATLKARWAKKGFGTIVCGDGPNNSTHEMFADDVTLFASSRVQLIYTNKAS